MEHKRSVRAWHLDPNSSPVWMSVRESSKLRVLHPPMPDPKTRVEPESTVGSGYHAHHCSDEDRSLTELPVALLAVLKHLLLMLMALRSGEPQSRPKGGGEDIGMQEVPVAPHEDELHGDDATLYCPQHHDDLAV